MAIAYMKPEIQIDLLTTIKEIALLTFTTVELQTTGEPLRFFPRAYAHGEKIIAAMKSKPHSVENQAYTWFALSVSTAAQQFIRRLRLRHELIFANRDKAIKEFLDKSMTIDEAARFTASTLLNPCADQVFKNAISAIQELVLSITRLTNFDVESLRLEFCQCLAISSYQVISQHSEFQTGLIAAISGPQAEAVQRELAWGRHNEWVQTRFQKDAVFSPDGSVTTPLSQVYLPLRGYWHEKLIKDQDPEIEETKWRAHVCWLHDEINQWLRKPNESPIRIVAGGPGSGKSSFAKAICCEIADASLARVIFVELQSFPFVSDLYTDIGRYLTQRHKPSGDGGSPGFPSNPLDWIKGTIGSTVLIFDGLDELTHDPAVAQEISRKFVLNVRHLVERMNADGTPVRAIILGRNAACQQGVRDSGLAVSTILNVAPIRSLSKEDFRPFESGQFSDLDERTIYPDLEEPFLADQRPGYWDRWTLSQGSPFKALPEAITHDDLADLNVEPLLLHLLILSDFCGDRWKEAAENKNVVYEDILRKVHDRNVQKQIAIGTYSTDDFFLMMECLGLAAFSGNIRGGTESSFLAIREVHARHRKKDLADFEAADLRSVILQTHARALEGAVPGFEFIHKSFGVNGGDKTGHVAAQNQASGWVQSGMARALAR